MLNVTTVTVVTAELVQTPLVPINEYVVVDVGLTLILGVLLKPGNHV